MTRRAATVALLTLALDASAAVVGYDVSASATVAVRSPLPGDVSVGVTTDLQLDPVAEGSIRWPQTSLTLRYAPQLIIREPQVRARVLPLHHGVLTIAHRFTRASLLVSQDFSYGVADIGSLRLPAGARPTGVFEAQTLGAVPYLRSASQVVVDGRPNEFVSMFLSAVYLVSGDPTGGLDLPLQNGPLATGAVTLVLDRRFSLITSAQATHAWFNTGAEQSIFLATESVEWRVARTTVLTLGVGVAYTRELVVPLVGGPLPGLFFETLPVALASAASLVEVKGIPVQLLFDVRLSPFADRFTGLVYERLEGRASANARLTRELTAEVSVGTGYAIDVGRSPQAGDSATFAEASLRWDATRWFALVGTGRGVYIEQPRTMTPGQLLWSITLAAVVRDRDTTSW
ncbi:MAG: hypothetical protein Q8N26_22170 [Myxococcales bacterium]|nr:hypothetical protein [Myxococcales bacterium]